MIRFLRRCLFEFRRVIGMSLARCRLHNIRFANVDGRDVVIKSRRRGSDLLIWAGNFYLSFLRSGVVILGENEWIRWELAVDAATNSGKPVRICKRLGAAPNQLITDFVPGESLRDILMDEQYSLEQKFAAIGWTLDALHELHSDKPDWGNGTTHAISHGDATTANVIIDMNNGNACWIDFDMRHLPSLSPVDRQADDLRALTYSVASLLPCCCYEQLVKKVASSNEGRSLIVRFLDRLTTDWSRPTTFHLAQAPLTWTKFISLRQTFMALTSLATRLETGEEGETQRHREHRGR